MTYRSDHRWLERCRATHAIGEQQMRTSSPRRSFIVDAVAIPGGTVLLDGRGNASAAKKASAAEDVIASGGGGVLSADGSGTVTFIDTRGTPRIPFGIAEITLRGRFSFSTSRERAWLLS